MKRTERITQMEERLDEFSEALSALSSALDKYEAALPAWKKLLDYYGGGLWMRDYEADEAGKLPKDLKRGVLSEDAVYDLIGDNRELITKMLEIAEVSLNKQLV